MLGDYKFFWKRCKEGLAGVDTLVEKKWADNVMEVKRVSERILTIRVRVEMKILNLVSVCTSSGQNKGRKGRVLRETV